MRPPLLDLVAESLSRAASTRKEDQPHVRAFVLWMELDTASARLGFGELTSTRTAPDAPTSAAAVAALGFSAATADPDPNITNRFAEELEWLRGRQFFAPHRPRGFEADGTALLGVALGIASLSRAEIDREAARDWLFGLLTRALAETPRTSWHHDLMLVAELVLRGTGGSTMISSDLKVALASKGLQTASDIDESQALDIILSLSHRADGPTRAATQMRALYWLLRSRPTLGVAHPTEDEVVRLLGRVEHSMRRWAWDEKSRTRSGGTAKWDILHEYHVQDLLWTILAPLFPDLEDEENLPSLGHKHPRADLGIPALGLIIEVKFVHGGSTSEFAKIIGEVAEDTGLYLSSDSAYTQIIAFVWDDSAHGEQHAELRQGLEKIRGVVGAVVLSRPGKMTRRTVADSSLLKLSQDKGKRPKQRSAREPAVVNPDCDDQ